MPFRDAAVRAALLVLDSSLIGFRDVRVEHGDPHIQALPLRQAPIGQLRRVNIRPAHELLGRKTKEAKMNFPNAASALALTIVIAAAAACSPTASLEVPPEATAPLQNGDAIVKRVDGVEVVARTDAWQGRSIDEHVMPLQATVRNDGNRPLKIRYESFSLVRDDGKRYNALPPFAVEGETVIRRARLAHTAYAGVSP